MSELFSEVRHVIHDIQQLEITALKLLNVEYFMEFLPSKT